MPARPRSLTPGQQIAQRRRQLGLTQRQIAEQIGVTPQAVSEWERDGAQPGRASTVAVDAILHAEGAITAAFGYLSDPGNGDLHAAVARLSEDVRRLADRVSALESSRAPRARARR